MKKKELTLSDVADALVFIGDDIKNININLKNKVTCVNENLEKLKKEFEKFRKIANIK